MKKDHTIPPWLQPAVARELLTRIEAGADTACCHSDDGYAIGVYARDGAAAFWTASGPMGKREYGQFAEDFAKAFQGHQLHGNVH